MTVFPDRRSLLKFGAALPFAAASLQARASMAPNRPRRRIIFICNSLGFVRRYYTPRKRGDLESSEYLKVLSKHSKKISVVENLFHPGMETSNHDSEKSFLTGAMGPEGLSFKNTISVDQVLVQKIGQETRFPFLSFSIYDRGWGCSWNDRGSAIPPMHDEEKIFKLLFEKEDLQERKNQIESDQFVLDCLKRDLKHIKQTGQKSEQYQHFTTLISELEDQLKHDRFWLRAEKPKVKNSLSKDRRFAFSTKVQNLFELARLAFQTDSTRVITISLDWIYGAINVPGATGGWHTLSHHGGREDALKSLRCIEADILKHFEKFLSDLDSVPEGDGTMLDQTTVVLGSNFGDASNHTCNNLPMVVAGGGLEHHQHLPLDQPTPLCNLWLELLRRNDINLDDFGTSDKSGSALFA